MTHSKKQLTASNQPDTISHLIDAVVALSLALKTLEAPHPAVNNLRTLSQDGLEHADEISLLLALIETKLRQDE